MMFWILVGCLLSAGVIGRGVFWAVERGHQSLRRAAIQAEPRDWSVKPSREAVIARLGSLSSFDDYMAEWQVS
jgi:hypothetical protein